MTSELPGIHKPNLLYKFAHMNQLELTVSEVDSDLSVVCEQSDKRKGNQVCLKDGQASGQVLTSSKPFGSTRLVSRLWCGAKGKQNARVHSWSRLVVFAGTRTKARNLQNLSSGIS
jgi:hypothetical protein